MGRARVSTAQARTEFRLRRQYIPHGFVAAGFLVVLPGVRALFEAKRGSYGFGGSKHDFVNVGGCAISGFNFCERVADFAHLEVRIFSFRGRGSLAENARFGSLDLHLWWKCRRKRTFWNRNVTTCLCSKNTASRMLLQSPLQEGHHSHRFKKVTDRYYSHSCKNCYRSRGEKTLCL